MVNEGFFTLMCAGVIGGIFGLLLAFFGYRMFLLLLPVWGFFFGLALGADTIQALLGQGFLGTITSWVVGFVVGAVFAVLSYLFYVFAVAVISGSLGYAVAAGLMYAIGMNPGFLVWLIAMIVALVVIFVTFRFNLQKWVIIIATSILGAGVMFGTILLLFYPVARFMENPVRLALEASPLLLILFIIMAALGVAVQYRQNKSYSLESYNRWESAG